MKLHRRSTVIKIFFLILPLIPIVAQAQSDPQMRMARALENGREYEQALAIYRQMYATQATNPAVIGGVNRCLEGLRQYPEQIAFLQDVISKNPNNLVWRINMGSALYNNGEKDRAIEIWMQVLQIDRSNVQLYRQVAGAMIQQRLYEEAIEVYQAGVERFPQQSSFYLDIGNLYKAFFEYGKATEYFLMFFEANPQQLSFIQRQVLSLTSREEKIPQVVGALEKYIAGHPQRPEIREILAGLYVKQRDYDRAWKMYLQLSADTGKNEYIQKFAREAALNGAYTHAMNGFNELIIRAANEHLTTAARFGLAATAQKYAMSLRAEHNEIAAQQQMAKAVQTFQDLITRFPTSLFASDAREALGDIYYQYYFDVDRSIAAYREYLDGAGGKSFNELVRIKLGDMYLVRGDLDDARKMYQQVRLPANKNLANFKLAELEYFSAQFARAVKQYNQILEQGGPADSLANHALQRQLFVTAYGEDSLSLAEYSRAELLVAQNKKSEAVRFLSELAGGESKLNFRSGMYCARLLMELERNDDARNQLFGMLERFPGNELLDEVIFTAAQNEEQAGQLAAALELYQRILIDFENSLFIDDARERARILDAQLRQKGVSG